MRVKLVSDPLNNEMQDLKLVRPLCEAMTELDVCLKSLEVDCLRGTTNGHF